MMVGKHYYSEADMMRMQRDAEERVRDMRNRSMQNSGQDNGSFMPAFAAPPGGRSWTAGPNTGRQNSSRGQQVQRNPARNKQVQRETEQIESIKNEANPEIAEPERLHTENDLPHSAPQAPEDDKKTTIIEDIVGSLGVDSDTLLIIGLILILVNQKADTTLILALAYLLI